MLHRFAKFLAACTVVLILAGSLVTSHDAGLSVPDWPTSYGWNMFTFPPSMWVANILYEHGHRLIASTRRLPHDHPGGLAVAGRPARLAALVRRRRARRGDRAGHPRRHHRPLFPAGGRLDGACGARGNFLLHDGRDRAVHLAAVEGGLRRRARERGRRRRRAAPPAGDGGHRPRLLADSHRRDDAAYRRGARDSRFPVDVRPPRPRSLEPGDRRPLRPPRRRARRHVRDPRGVRLRLVAPSRPARTDAARGAARRCSSRSR